MCDSTEASPKIASSRKQLTSFGMCGPYPRRRRYYQIREFQMASSADELESEDPDDELELDDSEPPTRAEDCSVVNF